MENSNYNSLTEKLIQNGILQSENDNVENVSNIFETHFKQMQNGESIETVPNEPLKRDDTQNIKTKAVKKRINQYDLDLVNAGVDKDIIKQAINFRTNASLKVLNRFLNFKKNKLTNPAPWSLEGIFFKFFPKLYNAKLAKDALSKLLELDIDTKTLLNKTIPYGEGENRYEDLIKYLSYANQIQKRLNKKIN